MTTKLPKGTAKTNTWPGAVFAKLRPATSSAKDEPGSGFSNQNFTGLPRTGSLLIWGFLIK
jgi:hypothetical protein